MATLAEAVDAAETDWIVSADITADYLTVEDETVAVLAHFPAGLDPQTRLAVAPRIRVARGAGGTTAASHADTTALTPLIPPASSGGAGAIAVTDGVTTVATATSIEVTGGTVTDAGGGVASVLVNTRIVGPVTVPFDHADIAGNFGMVRIGELGPGATVVKFWAVMTEAWAGTATALHLVISDTSDGNSTQDLNVLNIGFSDISPSANYQREITTGLWGFGPADLVTNYVGIAGPSGAWLLAFFGPGTATDGTFDIYALIADPL